MNVHELARPVGQPEPIDAAPEGADWGRAEGKGDASAGLDGAGAYSEPCCCCALWGKGGRVRIGLLIVAAVAMVAVLVWGFSITG